MRIYACPIVGTGGPIPNPDHDPQDPESPEFVLDAQRALVRDLAGVTRVRAVISVDVAEGPGRGKPTHPWALAYVEASNWTAVDGASDLYRLDDKLGRNVTNQERNQLAQRGVATRNETDVFSGWAELVDYLIGKHYPGLTFAAVFPEFV